MHQRAQRPDRPGLLRPARRPTSGRTRRPSLPVTVKPSAGEPSTTAPSFASSKSASTRCGRCRGGAAHATPMPPTPVTTTTSLMTAPSRRRNCTVHPTESVDRACAVGAGRVSGMRSITVSPAFGSSSSLVTIAGLAPWSRRAERCRDLEHRRSQPPPRARRDRRSATTGRPGSPSSCSAARAGAFTAGVGRHRDERAVHDRPTPCVSPAWPRRSAARPQSRAGGRRQADARRHRRRKLPDAAGGVGEGHPGAAAAAHERRPRLQQEPGVPGGGRCVAGGRASPEELLAYVADQPLRFTPGTEVQVLELRQHPRRADGGRRSTARRTRTALARACTTPLGLTGTSLPDRGRDADALRCTATTPEPPNAAEDVSEVIAAGWSWARAESCRRRRMPTCSCAATRRAS